MSASPRISVVVGLISGKTSDLQRCLRALQAGTRETVPDIVVPYDDPCAEVATLQAEFPEVRFIHAEGLDTAAARAGASREHHDTLRTIGIRAASGEVIALTEDHAYVAETWCAEMIAALDRHPNAAAVGGAVECDSDRLLNWAVWFCDFGRYQNPLPEGRAGFVSDSNVAYRRAALERVAPAWAHDYHETAVHEAMMAAGYDICTTPRVVVWQARSGLSLGSALRERYVWARSFAGTRSRLIGARRFILAALTPVLPLVMTWRLAMTAMQRGRHTGRFVACLPMILMLQAVWAVGELVGYVTADPGALPPTRART
jgi:GT2 family glycosyltransferase